MVFVSNGIARKHTSSELVRLISTFLVNFNTFSVHNSMYERYVSTAIKNV